MSLPSATYRIQFRDGMDFSRAEKLVPYLKRLGISHLYASPIFAAVTGSTHGYDVTDHNEIDATLGGRAGLDALGAALKAAGMGLILDIVPNHMAASLENPWWRSVVEWGEQSPHAGYFDIDWSERLTLPILGKPFEEAVRDGEIALAADREAGVLALAYFDQKLPLYPPTWNEVLARLDRNDFAEFGKTAAQVSPADAGALHDKLRALLAQPIDGDLARLSQEPGLLAEIHDGQPWRLTFWKEARRHLSYRRFFEVTGLVGVRVEEPAVFGDVHRLILELVRSGTVDGLRVDHVDGLADPEGYLQRLRSEIGDEVYLVVEKILERDEVLPSWPVAGTTGYEFISALADAMVDPDGLAELQSAYEAHAGRVIDPEREKREARRLMVRRNFEGELTALVAMAAGLSPDALPEAELRAAIVELILAFPVYRTYGTAGEMPEADAALLEQVADDVRSRGRAKAAALDMVLSLLRGDTSGEEAALFRTRFQQLTGPIMAKSVEDTFFYRFNPLIALNEVGGDPVEAGSIARFHAFMAERVLLQPHGLSATATHDTKRGEDARARLYALSERPRLWAEAVGRWHGINAGKVEHFAEGPAPGPGTEWMLYQALAGVWPDGLDAGDTAGLEALKHRFLPFVEKALREAKRRTSWTDVDEAYEKAVEDFATHLLSPSNRAFLDDFTATLEPFLRAGRINGLSQTLVKLVAPGIPDIYQGAEGVDLSLVDPDNRRLVDFAELEARLGGKGVSKQHLIAAGLDLRRRQPELFAQGSFERLVVTGEAGRHVVAFLRRHGSRCAIAVAPRLTLDLADETGTITPERWGDTTIALPEPLSGIKLHDVLSGRIHDAAASLPVARLLGDWPVALLTDAGRQEPRTGDAASP